MRKLFILFALIAFTAQATPTVSEVRASTGAGDWQKATDQMVQVLEEHPTSPRAHYIYAQILGHTRQYTYALMEARTAQELDPDIHFTDPQKFQEFMVALLGSVPRDNLGNSDPPASFAQQFQSPALAKFYWVALNGEPPQDIQLVDANTLISTNGRGPEAAYKRYQGKYFLVIGRICKQSTASDGSQLQLAGNNGCDTPVTATLLLPRTCPAIAASASASPSDEATSVNTCDNYTNSTISTAGVQVRLFCKGGSGPKQLLLVDCMAAPTSHSSQSGEGNLKLTPEDSIQPPAQNP